jgi:hypothetical protein
MFIQTWKKYLPIIVFLMKRSVKGDQVLDMNFTDFEKATGGKKVKLGFSNLILNNGRIDSDKKPSPLANDLMLVLQQNEQSASMMSFKQFEFDMNSQFQLTIRNTTPLLIS